MVAAIFVMAAGVVWPATVTWKTLRGHVPSVVAKLSAVGTLPGTNRLHLAIGLPDVYATCEHLRAAGATITREPGPVKFGTTVIAFVEDPDGYKIELLQRD